MGPWRIFDYISDRSHNLIEAWYINQDDGVRAQFDIALQVLRATKDWEDVRNKGRFKACTKKHVGLGEVMFTVEGTPQRKFRPLGAWPVRIC